MPQHELPLSSQPFATLAAGIKPGPHDSQERLLRFYPANFVHTARMAIKLVIRANPGDSVDPLGTVLHNVALLPNLGDEIVYAAKDGTAVHARVSLRRLYFTDDDQRVELTWRS